jgi:antitoxin component YwqK of YwqJK toxin-antitoxin module
MIFNNGEPWTGEWHVWHENGQKELEQSWKDGQSTGTVIDW